MGLFPPTTKKIAKELQEIQEIEAEKVLNAKNLQKVREWLISINTRIRQGTLTGKEEAINKIKKLLKFIENREKEEHEAVAEIEGAMYELVR